MSHNTTPAKIDAGTCRKLIRDWSVFIATVRHGYSFSLWDYENDLYVRDRIQIALNKGVDLQPEMRTTLSRLDQEFKALLVPLRMPLLKNAPPEEFWYFGLPLNANPELLQDAQRLGFLEKGVTLAPEPVGAGDEPPAM